MLSRACCSCDSETSSTKSHDEWLIFYIGICLNLQSLIETLSSTFSCLTYRLSVYQVLVGRVIPWLTTNS